MKKPTPILILSLLFLIVGCSTDIESLQERNNLYYEVNSDKPFSGSIFSKYESGQKNIEGFLRNGKPDGLQTIWYENGQKKIEGTYVNGKENGLQTQWYENGQKWIEITYKDGEIISVKRWNEDGSVRKEPFVWE